MFGIDFSEMLVIAIVALVVIGPERLPKVARTAGLLLGRLQRYVSTVKADINREMQLDELRQMKVDMQEAARAFEQRMNEEMHAVQQAVQAARLPAPEEPAALNAPEHAAESVANKPPELNPQPSEPKA